MKHIFCYSFDISKIRESCNIVTMSKNWGNIWSHVISYTFLRWLLYLTLILLCELSKLVWYIILDIKSLFKAETRSFGLKRKILRASTQEHVLTFLCILLRCVRLGNAYESKFQRKMISSTFIRALRSFRFSKQNLYIPYT